MIANRRARLAKSSYIRNLTAALLLLDEPSRYIMKNSDITPTSQNMNNRKRLPDVNRPIAASSKSRMSMFDVFLFAFSTLPESRVTKETIDAISTRTNDIGENWNPNEMLGCVM